MLKGCGQNIIWCKLGGKRVWEFVWQICYTIAANCAKGVIFVLFSFFLSELFTYFCREMLIFLMTGGLSVIDKR
jgi:hypothetical protein